MKILPSRSLAQPRPIQLILSNDWELYGEGSGDFEVIQEARLKKILDVVEDHGARLSMFAEVGQQASHLREAAHEPALKAIARRWEELVRETIRRGHDVQLHYHPTWHRARRENNQWVLDLKTWALNDLPPETIVERLSWGKRYLESLGQTENSAYRCLVFRAGAFCIQPVNKMLPHLLAAGLLADSSIVPGYWDYLHFDFRKEPAHLGPYDLRSVLELPLHTSLFWDSPLLRRILPRSWTSRLFYDAPRDLEHEQWARERDKTLNELCVIQDPLYAERRKARLDVRNVPSFFLRKTSLILDYDFMAPQVFVSMVKRAAADWRAKGHKEPLVLVALGHANDAHNPLNLHRILEGLKKEFQNDLSFTTFQDTVAERFNAASGTKSGLNEAL